MQDTKYKLNSNASVTSSFDDDKILVTISWKSSPKNVYVDDGTLHHNVSFYVIPDNEEFYIDSIAFNVKSTKWRVAGNLLE